MLKIFKQKVCEGCLAVCLISLLREKGHSVADDEEGPILFGGLKITTEDFALGHLEHVCRRFPELGIEMYIHYKRFCSVLNRLKESKNLSISHQKIDLHFLRCVTKPVIIYIDAYLLCKVWKVPRFHTPHFVILSYIDDGKAVIHDPMSGRMLVISTENLMKSIELLKKRLWWSPKVIMIQR